MCHSLQYPPPFNIKFGPYNRDRVRIEVWKDFSTMVCGEKLPDNLWILLWREREREEENPGAEHPRRYSVVKWQPQPGLLPGYAPNAFCSTLRSLIIGLCFTSHHPCSYSCTHRSSTRIWGPASLEHSTTSFYSSGCLGCFYIWYIETTAFLPGNYL